MDNKIDIKITATDQASEALTKLGNSINITTTATSKLKEGFTVLKGVMANLLADAAANAFNVLSLGIKNSIESAERFNKNMLSASVVLPRLGQNAEEVTKVAKNLGAELRIGTTAALEGLQKLLKSGLNLEQAADLMKRFTNEAIIGRSAGMSLTQAVGNLVDMYYMEISALGNLSGISENVSNIIEKGLQVLQKQGKYLGKSVNQLSEAARAEAKYAGFIALTNETLGVASKLQGTYSDNLEAIKFRLEESGQALGNVFLPVLTDLTAAMLDLIDQATPLTKQFINQLTPAIQSLTKTSKELLSVLINGVVYAFGFLRSKVLDLWESFRAVYDNIGGVFSNLGESIKKTTTVIIEQLGAILGKILEVVGSSFLSFLNQMIISFDNVLPEIKEVVKAVLSFAEAITTRLTPIIIFLISNVIGPLIEILIKGLGVAFEHIARLSATVLPPVFNFLISTFDFVAGAVRRTIEVLQFFGQVGDFVAKLFTYSISVAYSQASPYLDALGNIIKNHVAPAILFLRDVVSVSFEIIKNTIKGAINWIIDNINRFIDSTNGIINNINNSLGNVIGSRLPNIGKLSKLATGTISFEGGAALVGERGPELVFLPNRSQVLNNTQTQNYTKNNSFVINNYITRDIDLYKLDRIIKQNLLT